MPDGSVTIDVRTRILDATEAIVRAHGVSGLTLEKAAREAGVSKGGLLYHFASKEALLSGLLARMADWLEHDFEASVAAQPEGPGRIGRAMLAWAFGQTHEAMNERCDRSAAVFLATFHHDPALLDPVRAVIARIRAVVAADGLPPGHAGVIMAASDGLFMARTFGLYTPTEQERHDMQAALSRLLEPVV
ncbi:TetR/AcrR family transcriptional regulator [Roseicella aquatilis]|uniref:TetR/AcrR family transcriptional regulator n=1 Tax=Roseicella aquatilis TaxID=2527868 RepID=A0A4R4DYD2_9PROT|nr:TetR/AcrR family transcriptional regulator [Roseicella aquatilis]TCZ66138.1 TetR/AcrR family transcriptional regulator [Roseicella aquatilis]